MELKHGLLIAFEGVDCSGKDTQVDELAKRLIMEGFEVITIDFPSYDTPSGQAIRAILDDIHPLNVRDNPHEVQALYAINRYEQQARIETALMQGKVVICNRYIYSAVTYGASTGLDTAWTLGIQHSLVQPDITIVLDIDFEEYKKRSRNRESLDAYESNEQAIKTVIDLYRLFSEQNEFILLDGKGEIEEIADMVLHNIKLKVAEMEE